MNGQDESISSQERLTLLAALDALLAALASGGLLLRHFELDRVVRVVLRATEMRGNGTQVRRRAGEGAVEWCRKQGRAMRPQATAMRQAPRVESEVEWCGVVVLVPRRDFVTSAPEVPT